MPRLPSVSGPVYNHTAVSRLRAIVSTQYARLQEYSTKLSQWYREQPVWKKILVIIGLIFAAAVLVLIGIFHIYLIKLLVDLSEKWTQLKYGKLILFTLIFFVGFPPLIGFSTLSLLAGMSYGFPNGWPLLASAMVLGSFASFLVFRYLLHKQAEKLVHLNEKFKAFSEILREDSSLFLLILIRLCPLPYSLSNGALAAIPELPALTYLAASLITSPKLLIHIYVGHKLKDLGDREKPHASKILDVVSILITSLASALTTYIIYHKMQQKLDLYHAANNNNGSGYDQMIFGNFEDDLESGVHVELNSTDFDEDNFIIEDEEEVEGEAVQKEQLNSTKKGPDFGSEELEIGDDPDGLEDFESDSRGYRH